MVRVNSSRINLFRFNCFCILVCRDDNKTKANCLHELLKYTNKAIYGQDFIQKKIGVTWNNNRLRDIIFFMTYLAEFMPKIWYNKTLFLAKRNQKEINYKSGPIAKEKLNMSVISSEFDFERE